MNYRSAVLAIAVLLLHTAVNLAVAEPVQYTFYTGASSFTALPELADTTVTGTFMYDASAPLTFTTLAAQNPANASGYGPHAVPGGFHSSYTDLSATLSGGAFGPAGIGFSDPRGSTIVSNDGLVSPPGTPPVDFIGLDADPFGPTGVHNIVPITIGDYTLWNMRLFWGEFTVGGDFLANQDLPGVLPSSRARLSLDFVATGNTSGTPLFSNFYEDVYATPAVAIPEPQTYALLLAGLALLGFEVRRRRRLR